ncbi:chemotaxis protein CheA [bacterium]|nr:chemotaxis protein CheA [bacterium]
MEYNSEELNEILKIYKSESEEIIQELNDGFLVLEKNPDDKAPLKKLFQLAHSLKSSSRMIGFNSVQDIAHQLEDILSFWKREDVSINTDFFQQIYKICDFLNELVIKSTDLKANYIDEKIVDFINNINDFITLNHMITVDDKDSLPPDYIKTKIIDINALILELMFVLEKDSPDSVEDVLSIISENIIALKEIFINTNYTNIRNKIDVIIEYTKQFDITVDEFNKLKEKILDLRNEIYNLYKELDINTVEAVSDNDVIPSMPTTEEIEKKDYLEDKFDFIISNLIKIKNELPYIPLIIEKIRNLSALSNNSNIESILSKVNEILMLFENKNMVVDNDSYMVILQSIFLTKRLTLNEAEANENGINSILQRLNVVKDMFNIKESSKNSAVEPVKDTSLIKKALPNLDSKVNSINLQEIRTLRVDTDKIDNLISRTSELIINGIKTKEHLNTLANINTKIINWTTNNKKVMNYFKYLERRGFFHNIENEGIYAFYKKIQAFLTDNSETINDFSNDFNKLYNIIAEDDNKLNQTVMEIESIAKGIRVLPLAAIFHTFPRMIRDIAKEKGKEIDFIITGSDTTVDKNIIEEIKMPLIHILRNAVSHGIETPDMRLQNGKKETGVIRLSAKQAESDLILTITDDGYGINLIKVKNTAIQKGLLSREEAENMNNEQLMKLLFVPGFSTEDSVSDISGRGIGLDIVKTKISNLNGEILIDSELNKGCMVTIKIPLSTSTIRAFIINVNNQKYAIPINSIKYVKQIREEDIYIKNGQDCILFEDKSIPIYSLSAVFGGINNTRNKSDNIKIIIIKSHDKYAGYIVDELFGDKEIFHKKPVPPIMKIKNISGFTALPTGEVCLIINPYELVRNTALGQILSLSQIKKLQIENKKAMLENKKIVLFNNDERLNIISEDLKSADLQIPEFNNSNSVIDFISHNHTDTIICSVCQDNYETLDLIKYIKNDENYINIKWLIFAELSDFELSQILQEYNYEKLIRFSKYKKGSIIEELSNLYAD